MISSRAGTLPAKTLRRALILLFIKCWIAVRLDPSKDGCSGGRERAADRHQTSSRRYAASRRVVQTHASNPNSFMPSLGKIWQATASRSSAEARLRPAPADVFHQKNKVSVCQKARARIILGTARPAEWSSISGPWPSQSRLSSTQDSSTDASEAPSLLAHLQTVEQSSEKTSEETHLNSRGGQGVCEREWRAA